MLACSRTELTLRQPEGFCFCTLRSNEPPCKKSGCLVGVFVLKDYLKREQHWECLQKDRGPHHPGFPAELTLSHKGVRIVSEAVLDSPAPAITWETVRLIKKMQNSSRKWLLDVSTYCCSVAQLCLTLCDPMDCSTPGFPVLHYLLELA